MSVYISKMFFFILISLSLSLISLLILSILPLSCCAIICSQLAAKAAAAANCSNRYTHSLTLIHMPHGSCFGSGLLFIPLLFIFIIRLAFFTACFSVAAAAAAVLLTN